MENLRLFMLLLGCKPPGRFTEQHDIFFGIARDLPELLPAIVAAWPEAPKIHIDAWREVTMVDGYRVTVQPREHADTCTEKLFFLNLGGYKPGEFEEYHYKMLVVATNKSIAIQEAKATAFYRHTGFAGASSHIDDKYGIDVDDLYEIEDILPDGMKDNYTLALHADAGAAADEWHLGYTKLSSLMRETT
jgi:hypothetical protein